MLASLEARVAACSSIQRAPHEAQKARRRGLTTITILVDRQTGQETVVILPTSSERIQPSISTEDWIVRTGERTRLPSLDLDPA